MTTEKITTSDTGPTAAAGTVGAGAALQGGTVPVVAGQGQDAGTDAEQVIRLYEEALRVDKRRTVTDRVLLHKTVSTREEVAELMLRQTKLEVERVPVGRAVTEVPAVREEGDMLIVPLVEEVLVVEKRLMLTEELRIRRRESVEQVRETVQLRREEAVIERPSLAQRPEQEK